MDKTVMKQIIQIIHHVVDANKEYAHIWKEHILFTWQWWLRVAITVVPIGVWILARKKNSTARLLYVGFFVLLLVSWMDFVGNSYGLWYYPLKIVPTLPPLIPWGTFITVEVLLVLQFKPTFPYWIKAIALGIVNSFVGEPLAKWAGLYVPVHWRYIYSLPIYTVIYLTAHVLAQSKSFMQLDENKIGEKNG